MLYTSGVRRQFRLGCKPVVEEIYRHTGMTFALQPTTKKVISHVFKSNEDYISKFETAPPSIVVNQVLYQGILYKL